MLELDKLHASVLGGGSGPIPFEEYWLDKVPNTDSIVPCSDNGGHTRDIRATLNMAATGDAASRIAVHIRNNPIERGKYTFRHRENGHRTGNHLLAYYYRVGGGLAEAIALAEQDAGSDYVGKVYPVSNDGNIHVVAYFQDGSEVRGEDLLDYVMKSRRNRHLERIALCPTPKPYQPALDSIRLSDARIVTPGSWLGSTLAVCEVPGVYESLKEGKGPVVCITNAVDVAGRRASYYLHYLSQEMQRPIDLAIVNQPGEFDLPESYSREHNYFVEPDEQRCRGYANEVVALPIIKLQNIDGFPTIRHDGRELTNLILKYLETVSS